MIEILCAFILGGCMCVLFQAIGTFTKAAPPKILLWSIAAGALLGALGITAALGAFGGAGLSILVIGFGEGVLMAVQAALSGEWMPAIILVSVVVLLTVIGIITGAVHLALTKGKATAEDAGSAHDGSGQAPVSEK